jgi:hypothetical protein
MKRRRTFKAVIIAAPMLIAGIAGYQLLFGKLFPLSPVIIGFERHELANTVIYVQDGAAFTEYREIDALTAPVEEFHRLGFLKKPRIFIFRDRESYLRRSITRARFNVYPDSSMIVSPWALEEARQGKISLAIYVTHELSHSLLYQHMGIVAAYRYPRWLMEGIAMCGAGQMGTSWYPGREETYDLIRRGNYFPPEYYATRKEGSVRLDVPYRIAFIYSEFACIVEYLIETGGRERFLAYMKALLEGEAHDRVFRRIYNNGLDDFLRRFREHAGNGPSRPKMAAARSGTVTVPRAMTPASAY